jgi:diguanylate cyclase (GGDEF)-like protein
MESTPPCSVLIVDDDQTILRLFSIALERSGYAVRSASTGLAALEQFAAREPDVVLLDINLPDISGIEIMRRVARPTRAAFILITGDDAAHTHDTAIREGAMDFIVKPVRLPELLLRIRQVVKLRELAEAKERLIADLARLAIHDELTGLYNYRHFHDELRAEVQRALRYQRPLSLVVFDTDEFKSINDTLGHSAGDRVLAGIAGILRDNLRSTDSGYRYGGDEFAVLLPETACDEALNVAERIRKGIEQAAPHPERRVTISGGVAELRADETADAILQRADAALYESKRAGRNRVAAA